MYYLERYFRSQEANIFQGFGVLGFRRLVQATAGVVILTDTIVMLHTNTIGHQDLTVECQDSGAGN
jgi:hypothetical protein